MNKERCEAKYKNAINNLSIAIKAQSTQRAIVKQMKALGFKTTIATLNNHLNCKGNLIMPLIHFIVICQLLDLSIDKIVNNEIAFNKDV
jgi:hypothetical protein